jgi:hypothetical protein
MSYATVIAGLHVRFATVAGIVRILDYAPTSIGDTPMLYSVLTRMDCHFDCQVRVAIYRINHRLLFRWQDNEQAEIELLPYVDSIPKAVEGVVGASLGGTLVGGMAELQECEAGWVDIAGTTYRVLDFYSTVTEKNG